MIENIKKILTNREEISAWKLKLINTEAQELFFIKKALEMNRYKNVEHLELTIYIDSEEGGVKYRGASSIELHPTLTDEEIIKEIEATVFAASLIKNEYYPIVDDIPEKSKKAVSNFSEKPLVQWIEPIAEAIFSADIYVNGCVNSAELFLNKDYTRIVNSEGIDVDFTTYNGKVEFIVNWSGNIEEIELYKAIEFSEFDASYISNKVNDMLKLAKDKAVAVATPNLEKSTVLLTGESAKSILKYYYSQASAEAIYNKVSVLKLGESVQGKSVEGDLISITLEPELKGSTKSASYDNDGSSLSRVDLYSEGKLMRYWGNKRYCYYLGVAPTGIIENFIVKGGKKSIEDLKSEPHLEIIAFSDFQINNLTGNYAGEIRLGWYYDGITTIPVTGGSISGNIKCNHEKMFLSRELQQDNNYVGPKTIKLFDVTVAGI
jgi:PmbA protein